ncbi:oxidoreductase [Streptomyces sp. HCCB10043]|uniref:Oxidoreductase n=1 Tax=Streptomyces filamentosus NRRL 15998 TaxID=457431 RepID=D6APH5_STRFL|nr:oxidoreductase [Streptomyces filamentosus NRRL 15998]ESU49256.1 oxidoreductase [Streptomyces sp. HCCB10043]EWS92694.1 oxidoreductase [Streptomyces filamentosus NRRL 11379]
MTVGAIGLGAMPLSVEGRPGEEQAVATIHAALEAGVRLIDTADCYQWYADELGHNERLIARALAAWGSGAKEVLVATKGGRRRPGDGSWTVNGDPRHLRRAAEASATRLGVEAVGLYQLHKPDPAVPFAESVGALRDLADAGTIRAAGLSNVDAEQIRTAYEILGPRLVSVQNRFSPAYLSTRDTLDLCTELGLAFLPWSPLGGISRSAVDDPGTADPAPGTPFHTLARIRGVSPQQVCLAWHLAQSPVVVPIPGARRPASVRDSAGAAGLTLSASEMTGLHL